MLINNRQRALVIGNLAGYASIADGQVIKTQQFLRSLERHATFAIEPIDTSGPKTHLILEIIRRMTQVDLVFLLPGRRMVLVFALLTRIIIIIRGHRPRIHLIVVGGWLPSLLGNPSYRWALRHVDTVSPEVISMWDKVGFAHPRVLELPNFREPQGHSISNMSSDESVRRFVFLSRVTQSKGIFDAISVLKSLSARGEKAQLDIYGPLLFGNSRDEEAFRVALSESEGAVQYRGEIPSTEVGATLAGYECCLFPSAYHGEGFPGVIVEALLVGVPVIARSHMFLEEINHRFDFGLVISGDFVEGAVDALCNNTSFIWKENWAGRDRRVELMERLGPEAFEVWLREVELDNPRR